MTIPEIMLKEKKTEPQLFIIESLHFSDEKDGRFEGQRIHDMLIDCGKQCHYFYIRTENELEEILSEFWDSKFRYLHLSCHANKQGIEPTVGDMIPFEKLATILEPYLEKRRLFMSGCRMGSQLFAKQLLNESNCFSIVGPSIKVDIADSAMFWAAFYHKMFRLDSEKMIRRHIIDTAKTLATFFSVPLNYFHLQNGTLETIAIPGKNLKTH